MAKRIDLQPAEEYRKAHYGVILKSITLHDMTGPGVHNRHHPHELDVWEHRRKAESGRWIDPTGTETDEPYSFLFSAQAVVISARREERPPQGETLAIGDRVALYLYDMHLGDFEVQARPLRDPHLVRVD